MEGVVRSIDAGTSRCLLEADKYVLPDGRQAVLAPARQKTISWDKRSKFEPASGDSATISSIRPGMRLGVCGPDKGSGSVLQARLIVLLNQNTKTATPSISLATPTSTQNTAPVSFDLSNKRHDLTEGSAALWRGFASDKEATTLENDMARVRVGRSSLKFTTKSGFDTGVRLSPKDSWNLSNFRYLRFWIWAQNDNEFQGPQPIVILQSGAGRCKYVPRQTSLLKGAWQQFYVPLSGIAGDAAVGDWQRSVEGNFSLQAVTALEIHGDTWGHGFTWYLDGFSFTTPQSIKAPYDELTENNAEEWETTARSKTTPLLTNENLLVRSGEASLRFVTNTSQECSAIFKATNAELTGAATELPPEIDSQDDIYWDAGDRKYLTFWVRAENAGEGRTRAPVVLLGSPGGQWRYESSEFLPDRQWRQYWVPLSGDERWKRTAIGVPDLKEIRQIELLQRPGLDSFQFIYDGVRLMNEPELPPAPPPPPGVNPLVIEPRVLLIVYNPILKAPRAFAGMRVHEAFKWGDPIEMANQTAADIRLRTHGLVRFQLADIVIAEGYPPYRDGFAFDDLSYVREQQSKRPNNRQMLFDYDRFIQEYRLTERVASGEVDEVWVYSPPDLSATWEAAMAGRGAYFINGSTYKAGDKAFAIMGLNCQAGLANAMHSFGHRVESTMKRIYGRWEKDQADNWSRFTLLNKDAPGLGGVGNIHFPVNGRADYQYDSTEEVITNADDWYNYPHFKGLKRRLNHQEWTPVFKDSHRGYMHWWFDHIPHFAGVGPDGFLCNWWRYAFDHDAFKYYNGSLKGTKNIPFVRLKPLEAKDHTANTIAIHADADVDGVMGRVDFYVDGRYQASDTIAPYVFHWDTRGQQGTYEVVAKAYELARGGEAVSEPLQIHIK